MGRPAGLGELVIGVVIGDGGYWLGVITDGLFSAVVIMAMVTTIMTPIVLKWSVGPEVGLGDRLRAGGA